MKMFFFHKRDEPKKPFVIIRAKDKLSAQKKLVEILSGLEYKGTWEQSEVPKNERKNLLKQFRVEKIYEADVPGEHDLIPTTKDYGIDVINQVRM